MFQVDECSTIDKNRPTALGEVKYPQVIQHGHPFEVKCVQKCWIPPEQNANRLLSLSIRHTNGSLQTLSTVSFFLNESALQSSFINFTSDIENSYFFEKSGRGILAVRIKNVKPFQLTALPCRLRLNSTHEIHFTSNLLNANITGITEFAIMIFNWISLYN